VLQWIGINDGLINRGQHNRDHWSAGDVYFGGRVKWRARDRSPSISCCFSPRSKTRGIIYWTRW
jgi:hypothetical protein